MGVMSCYRVGCDEIMCRTYIESVGYVCNGCQSEFKEYLSSKGIVANTENEIRKELKLFMDTPKDEYSSKEGKREVDVNTFFREHTR